MSLSRQCETALVPSCLCDPALLPPPLLSCSPLVHHDEASWARLLVGTSQHSFSLCGPPHSIFANINVTHDMDAIPWPTFPSPQSPATSSTLLQSPPPAAGARIAPPTVRSPSAPVKRCTACEVDKVKADFFSVQWTRSPDAHPRCKECIGKQTRHAAPSLPPESPLDSSEAVRRGQSRRPKRQPRAVTIQPAIPQPSDELLVQVCDACISVKPRYDFSSQQWSAAAPPRRCLLCESAGNDSHTRHCNTCLSEKSRHEYIATEWSHVPRRCNACLLACSLIINEDVAGTTKALAVAAIAGLQQCNACGQRRGHEYFSSDQWKRSPFKRRCMVCVAAPVKQSHTVRSVHQHDGTSAPDDRPMCRSNRRRRAAKLQAARECAMVDAIEAEDTSTKPTEYHSLPTTPQSVRSSISDRSDGQVAVGVTDHFSQTSVESDDERKESVKDKPVSKSVSSAVWTVDATCAVCHSQQCKAMLLPCYHVSCCVTCATLITKLSYPCPRCSVTVENFVKVKMRLYK